MPGRAGLTGTYPTRLNPDQLRERRRRLVDGAVGMLREATAKGLESAGRLRGDPAFGPLRSDPGFLGRLADLEFLEDSFASR